MFDFALRKSLLCCGLSKLILLWIGWLFFAPKVRSFQFRVFIDIYFLTSDDSEFCSWSTTLCLVRCRSIFIHISILIVIKAIKTGLIPSFGFRWLAHRSVWSSNSTSIPSRLSKPLALWWWVIFVSIDFNATTHLRFNLTASERWSKSGVTSLVSILLHDVFLK